jgi:hypothetical protein
MILYHGGSVEEDVYGNVSFYGMEKVNVMFDRRPSFGQIFARACEEISCNLNDHIISIQGLLSHITSEIVVRQLISIASEDVWMKYIKIVKMIVPSCLDVVVRMLSSSHCDAPVGLSPQMSNASRNEAHLPDLSEEVVVVPDAQSVPNKFEISRHVRGVCGASIPMVPQEIPLTQDPIQDHPNKCL